MHGMDGGTRLAIALEVHVNNGASMHDALQAQRIQMQMPFNFDELTRN